MKHLDDKNPFNASSPEHLAYQRAYAISREYLSREGAMCGRVLGYMLLEVPWGRLKVASEINSCNGNQKLVDLGRFYIDHFLRAFRSAKGPTPAPSDHPSRPSFDNERDMNSHVITEAPQDHRTSKRQALERDGYQCMLSGKLDATVHSDLLRKIDEANDASYAASYAETAAAANPASCELAEKAAKLSKEAAKLNATAQRAKTTLAGFPNAPMMCVTNAAHIFSEANNTDLGNDNKLEYASSMWAVMERFGQPGFRDELDGSKIHRLTNILTLEQFIHTQFDKLALWLEADASQHTYRICSINDDIKRGLPTTVTFKSRSDKFDLPDPRYIKMHAACARVAHLSGAGGYIADIMDDLDEGRTRVLSEDGSSDRMLDFSLLLSRGLRITTWG